MKHLICIFDRSIAAIAAIGGEFFSMCAGARKLQEHCLGSVEVTDERVTVLTKQVWARRADPLTAFMQ